MGGFKLPAWRITSPFGMRINPVTGVRSQHKGTDFGANSGTPINAIAPGVVSAKGVNLDKRTGFGYWVAIKQYDGSKGVYAHMREHSPLSVGTAVDHSTVIGYVGSTGASTGPHLHYQLEINGTPVDPVPYANARPVPKPGPAPTPAPSAVTYVIKRGDTLGAIAARYGIKWQDLYAANRGVIGANPNRIFSGQVLTIPGKSAPAPAPAPAGKTVTQVAREVIAGKWGNGADRRRRLSAAGYDPTTVQREVNRLLR